MRAFRAGGMVRLPRPMSLSVGLCGMAEASIFAADGFAEAKTVLFAILLGIPPLEDALFIFAAFMVIASIYGLFAEVMNGVEAVLEAGVEAAEEERILAWCVTERGAEEVAGWCAEGCEEEESEKEGDRGPLAASQILSRELARGENQSGVGLLSTSMLRLRGAQESVD